MVRVQGQRKNRACRLLGASGFEAGCSEKGDLGRCIWVGHGFESWGETLGPHASDCFQISHHSCLVSDEAKDFLGKCFVWSPSERFTAAKLLNHPFVTNLDPVKELSSVSSSSSKKQILPLGSKTCHSKSNHCLPKATRFPIIGPA
ncbi:hypothetical protein L3X38_018724 [Prunus dulcis]|uniref:Uncharacterized protein n=1 Tax=Prunus dulcis TaxID=3755 RepID=A0AAD4WC92_PRUDU|nr:hypothetical protein L3X38_018724 [Prunus dulcis]